MNEPVAQIYKKVLKNPSSRKQTINKYNENAKERVISILRLLNYLLCKAKRPIKKNYTF